MGLVVEAGPADMSCRGAFEQTFLFGVAVEAGHGAQPPGDRRPSAAALLEIAGVALDIRSADGEQAKAVFVAPGEELAQVQGVGVASRVAVAGQERGERVPLGVGERRVDDGDGSGRG